MDRIGCIIIAALALLISSCSDKADEPVEEYKEPVNVYLTLEEALAKGYYCMPLTVENKAAIELPIASFDKMELNISSLSEYVLHLDSPALIEFCYSADNRPVSFIPNEIIHCIPKREDNMPNFWCFAPHSRKCGNIMASMTTPTEVHIKRVEGAPVSGFTFVLSRGDGLYGFNPDAPAGTTSEPYRCPQPVTITVRQ